MQRTRGRTAAGERGFTLIEILVVVALLVIIGGSAYETLAQHPVQVRSTAVTFAELVAQARSLAALTDLGVAGGSGATIGVVREGNVFVATVYAYRPIRGASRLPEVQPNLPPLRTTTAIGLASGDKISEPPFAIFIAASGHASAQAGYSIGVSAPLAAEPACPTATGIALTFSDETHAQTNAVSCEMAHLDLDTLDPASGPTHLPQRAL